MSQPNEGDQMVMDQSGLDLEVPQQYAEAEAGEGALPALPPLPAPQAGGAEVEGTGVEGAGVDGAGVEGAGVEDAGVEGAGVEGAEVEGADGNPAEVKQEPNEQQMLIDEKPREPHKLAKAYRTTLMFRTDLSKGTRDSHPCGILHFARTSNYAEEHAFGWIANHDNPEHLEKALRYFEQFGFSRDDVSFIPYSTRRSWIEKYPLAFPHVHCGDHGQITGFPYWSADSETVTGRAAATSSGDVAAFNNVHNATSPATPEPGKRGRKRKKILPTANLPNEEREELHIEMYKYMKWLQTSLIDAQKQVEELPPAPDGKKRRSASSAAGINATGLEKLIKDMEATFKAVRNAGPTIAAEAGTNKASGLPFLEETLGEPLGRMVEAVKQDPEVKSARSKPRKGHDFEDMFERLQQFQKEHGHVNVAQKYAADGQLGSWVANIRSKRKQMAKRGEEFEVDVKVEDDANDAADDAAAGEGAEGGGTEGSAKKKRGGHGRQRLTQERIQRLDAIGFQWVVANPNFKSWEERFNDLREYQQLHGTTRVPRSSGTLGEWVHMQRRLYNKKDPNFLARKAPMLEDIGFEWHPRKHALVSWEDNFNRLMEFGRINRHYNVQSPFPEGYVEQNEADQDGELVEAHRFHKWVRRIHAEYRAYASGKGSRMLNDSRVMQLREIGFQFI